jgi:hypothetical protein
LRRTLVYSILAIALGLTLVLVPLMALAQIRTQDSSRLPESLPREFREIESPPSEKPRNASEVETLGVCFVIALVAYVFFRGRRPERGYKIIGNIPY